MGLGGIEQGTSVQYPPSHQRLSQNFTKGLSPGLNEVCPYHWLELFIPCKLREGPAKTHLLQMAESSSMTESCNNVSLCREQIAGFRDNTSRTLLGVT